jgi:hypothetical protein
MISEATMVSSVTVANSVLQGHYYNNVLHSHCSYDEKCDRQTETDRYMKCFKRKVTCDWSLLDFHQAPYKLTNLQKQAMHESTILKAHVEKLMRSTRKQVITKW